MGSCLGFVYPRQSFQSQQEVMGTPQVQGCAARYCKFSPAAYVTVPEPSDGASTDAGLPNNIVKLSHNTKKKTRLHGSLVSLAEFGSFGVEFYTLSERTGNTTYADTAEHVYR